MKKFLVLLMALFMFQGISYAAADKPNADSKNSPKAVVEAGTHFENIDYQNETKFYFDKNTIRYVKDPYREELLVDVWLKVPSAQGYALKRYLVRLKDRESMVMDEVFYTADNKQLSQLKHEYRPERWLSVIPDSPGSIWYQAILNYSDKNQKQLKREFEKKRGEL